MNITVSDTFNLIDPFDIQNAWIRVSYSLYKDYHLPKLANPSEVKFFPFNFFLPGSNFIGIFAPREHNYHFFGAWVLI